MNKIKQSAGFTLIEVLIALAIISIALLGVVNLSSYQIKAAEHLKQKTLAHWVGLQAIYSIQLGLVSAPISHRQTTLLNQNFSWSADKGQTQDPKISKISLTVFLYPKGQTIDVLQAFMSSN